MEMLELYRAGELLARYALGARTLEIGRALSCDVAVEDPELADRHFLLLRRRGTVVAFDVSAGRRQRVVEYPLPLDRAVPLGRNHELRRVERAAIGADVCEAGTDVLSYPRIVASQLQVVIGRASEARRVQLSELPVHFGRSQDIDVRLTDSAVSERHLRLEPCEAGLLARDLGSKNGTFVNGVRVHTALVTEGTSIRVGRTELHLVARSDDGGCATPPRMVAESSSMLEVLGEVRRVASLAWPVLIVGESGTGKEGIALALHERSARHGQPFVAVNAGGLTRELIESQLFGHERGAFTGAANRHRGVFEQAQGGTLFLDEIGELPLEQQARLLRVLESGEIRRVGSESAVRVDVRLVCATHRDLRVMVTDGTFRQDLFYRIARVVIQVPSLRVRPEDLRALVRRFLSEIGAELGPRELSREGLQRLLVHEWPGNVRELRNVLSAAAATCSGCIEVGDVDRALARVGGGSSVREVSSEMIRRALEESAGNQAAAARALGIPRSTLRDRMRLLDAGPILDEVS
ncbi:MAG TPA: sigma 54-interacting transcriptional regulator [Polyangiales bacterium]|nr:sigma 54-interacting transcriptional regulator [Polyangiales bacterium]